MPVACTWVLRWTTRFPAEVTNVCFMVLVLARMTVAWALTTPRIVTVTTELSATAGRATGHGQRAELYAMSYVHLFPFWKWPIIRNHFSQGCRSTRDSLLFDRPARSGQNWQLAPNLLVYPPAGDGNH